MSIKRFSYFHGYLKRPALQSSYLKEELDPFLGIVPLLYPLKTSENQRFSDVFRGYINGILAWNGVMVAQRSGLSEQIRTRTSIFPEVFLLEENLSTVIFHTMLKCLKNISIKKSTFIKPISKSKFVTEIVIRDRLQISPLLLSKFKRTN